MVIVIALNIETSTPIARVKAKPLTMLVPQQYRIAQVIIVVILESKILVKALSNPELIAVKSVLPAFSSSFVLSKINMFASTAIPILRMKPAIPARVNVTPNNLNIAKRITPYMQSAMSAIKPGAL